MMKVESTAQRREVIEGALTLCYEAREKAFADLAIHYQGPTPTQSVLPAVERYRRFDEDVRFLERELDRLTPSFSGGGPYITADHLIQVLDPDGTFKLVRAADLTEQQLSDMGISSTQIFP